MRFGGATLQAINAKFDCWPESKKVMILLAAIRTKTEDLRMAIHSINDDSGPNGKANNFEEAAKYVAKHIPDAKERPSSSLDQKALDTKVGVDVQEAVDDGM